MFYGHGIGFPCDLQTFWMIFRFYWKIYWGLDQIKWMNDRFYDNNVVNNCDINQLLMINWFLSPFLRVYLDWKIMKGSFLSSILQFSCQKIIKLTILINYLHKYNKSLGKSWFSLEIRLSNFQLKNGDWKFDFFSQSTSNFEGKYLVPGLNKMWILYLWKFCFLSSLNSPTNTPNSLRFAL